MDPKEVDVWSDAQDRAEQQPLTLDLPEAAPLGSTWEQQYPEGRRLWRRVLLISGNIGGRWAYWASWMTTTEVNGRQMERRGIGPHPEWKAIADRIFNGDAAHFIGMLGIPYVGKIPGVETPAWVLVEPRYTGPGLGRIWEEKPEKRYEKSAEVYDVETQTSTELKRPR